jgi:hypothetical protein
MNMALNNASNVIEYYRGKDEDVDIEVVAYGPGLNMLRTDSSPVRDRIKRLKDFSLQQHQARHGEARGARDLNCAGSHHRALRRGALDGIAGSRLELCPALTCFLAGTAGLNAPRQPCALQKSRAAPRAPQNFYICTMERSKFATKFDFVRNMALRMVSAPRGPQRLAPSQRLI